MINVPAYTTPIDPLGSPISGPRAAFKIIHSASRRTVPSRAFRGPKFNGYLRPPIPTPLSAARKDTSIEPGLQDPSPSSSPRNRAASGRSFDPQTGFKSRSAGCIFRPLPRRAAALQSASFPFPAPADPEPSWPGFLHLARSYLATPTLSRERPCRHLSPKQLWGPLAQISTGRAPVRGDRASRLGPLPPPPGSGRRIPRRSSNIIPRLGYRQEGFFRWFRHPCGFSYPLASSQCSFVAGCLIALPCERSRGPLSAIPPPGWPALGRAAAPPSVLMSG